MIFNKPSASILSRQSIFAATIAGLGCFYLYQNLSKKMDHSSHLVKQTLFNIARNLEAKSLFGQNPIITSGVNGIMLQRKGLANLTFGIQAEETCEFKYFQYK